jgi:outer membrane protein assembly factor BamA
MTRRALAAGAALLAGVFASRARADPSPPPAPPSVPALPPPAFAAEKPLMVDLDQKREGGFPTVVPIVAYDTNTGLGLGVAAFYFINGARSDPLFAVTPYRHRFFADVFPTTGGSQLYVVAYDGIYLGDTPLRVRAKAAFARNTEANYFGVGAATLRPLSFAGRTYATYSAENAAASAVRAGGVASPQLDHYDITRPNAAASLERDFLGGLLRVQYGFVVEHAGISRYDGRRVDATDGDASAKAIEAPTRLGVDCAAGRILGCAGGWNDLIKAGVAFDTRDFEPDPNRGVFVDLTGEWATRALGSSFDYARVTLAARAYYSPFPRFADVVLAGRVVYSIQSEGVPFFAMDTLALTEGDQAGLGGSNTLRGFRQDRFVGPVAALTNLEVRWTFVRFHLLKQLFSLQVAPFLDTGRVFDKVELDFHEWQVAGGAGAHIGWNQTTIIRIDAGFSREDSGIYIDFGMPF